MVSLVQEVHLLHSQIPFSFAHNQPCDNAPHRAGQDEKHQVSTHFYVSWKFLFMELRGQTDADSDASRREFFALGRQRGGASRRPLYSVGSCERTLRSRSSRRQKCDKPALHARFRPGGTLHAGACRVLGSHLVPAGKRNCHGTGFYLTHNIREAIISTEVSMTPWMIDSCLAGRDLRPQPGLTRAETRRRRERRDSIHNILCVPAAPREK